LRKDGGDLPRDWVGFRKANKFVRSNTTEKLSAYLDGLDKWFDHLEEFRHSLAHRIPLYIPPYIISPEKEEEYLKLADQMRQQITDRHEYDRLSLEQKALVVFAPVMMHSYAEKGKPVVFHAQLLANFATVEEFGHKLLDELGR
jgi:hypothetical protein